VVIIKIAVSLDVTPLSLVNVYQKNILLPLILLRSTLKTEAGYSSRTLVNIYQATRHDIPGSCCYNVVE
jgi:hypothetical protein